MKPLVEIFRYGLPLKRPVLVRGQALRQRTGFIVELSTDYGVLGYGDIAPLPGFSHETAEQALQAAVAWSRLLDRRRNHTKVDYKDYEFLLGAPSVAFGTQFAVLDLARSASAASRAGEPTHRSPCVDFRGQRGRVLISGLLADISEDARQAAQRLRDAGYRCAKLKVGRQDVKADIETVQAVSRILGEIPLRLDANRAWDFETAMTFARGIADCPIEYIEEPLADPSCLAEFARTSGLAVALDETVVEAMDDEGFLDHVTWVKAVVLKPTLLGGPETVADIATWARDRGITPVVSSCFESGVGIAALAHFAASISGEEVPAGLDTYSWLDDDVLATRLLIRDGALDLEEVDACVATIDTSRLERVYCG